MPSRKRFSDKVQNNGDNEADNEQRSYRYANACITRLYPYVAWHSKPGYKLHGAWHHLKQYAQNNEDGSGKDKDTDHNVGWCLFVGFKWFGRRYEALVARAVCKAVNHLP